MRLSVWVRVMTVVLAGAVSGVSYNSERRARAAARRTRQPSGSKHRGQLLDGSGGADRSARRPTPDRRAAAQRRTRRTAARRRRTEVDAVSLVSDAGEISSVALDPGISVRILEADLSQEVGRYLTLVGAERDQDVRRLTIATAGAGERDLFVSYISEVPVWKATYRLVLPGATETRKPLLQGWAIVDNTVAKTGTTSNFARRRRAAVLHSGDLAAAYVQRPVVPLPERMLLTPQTHQGTLSTTGVGALAGTVNDVGGGLLPGVTVRVRERDSRRHARHRLERAISADVLAPGTYDVTFSHGRVSIRDPDGCRRRRRNGKRAERDDACRRSRRVGQCRRRTTGCRAHLAPGISGLGGIAGGAGGGRGGGTGVGRGDSDIMIDGIARPAPSSNLTPTPISSATSSNTS